MARPTPRIIRQGARTCQRRGRTRVIHLIRRNADTVLRPRHGCAIANASDLTALSGNGDVVLGVFVGMFVEGARTGSAGRVAAVPEMSDNSVVVKWMLRGTVVIVQYTTNPLAAADTSFGDHALRHQLASRGRLRFTPADTATVGVALARMARLAFHRSMKLPLGGTIILRCQCWATIDSQ